MMNLTKDLSWLETIIDQDYQMSKGSKIALSLAYVGNLITGLLTHYKLYCFLEKLSQRTINKILSFDSVIRSAIFPLAIVMQVLFLWFENETNQILGDWGCYFFAYQIFALIVFLQSQSFFMALFRYICVAHEDKLRKWHLTPKVSNF